MDSKGVISGGRRPTAAKIQFLLCALPTPLQSLGSPRHLPTSKEISDLALLLPFPWPGRSVSAHPREPQGAFSPRRAFWSHKQCSLHCCHYIRASTFPPGELPGCPEGRGAPVLLRMMLFHGFEGAAAMQGLGKPELARISCCAPGRPGPSSTTFLQ